MDTTLFFGQIALGLAMGLSAVGSALGIGAAGRAAAGAWAKEAKAGKSLNFSYLILVGMPLSQTIYGFILMLIGLSPIIVGNPQFAAGQAGTLLGIGLAGGLAEFFSAWMQGRIGAAAVRCMSEGEGKGLAFLMFYLGMDEMFGSFILGMSFGKYGTLALIFGIYLILGMFFEGISMMVITLPFVMPIIGGFGLSGYWFAVPLVIMVEASLITPPVGLNLYVLQAIAPDYDVLDVAKGALPFLLPMLLVVVLVVVFPELALWFPNLIYGK